MSKEIARFQLTSGANNLERWVIPDNVNVITENTDSTHYSEAYQHQFYNSAIINFDTSLYGYLWASSMLLFDASCQITVEQSTDGGSTWSNYRTANFQRLWGSFYSTSGSSDSGIGGTYWLNMNSNNAQCISSVLPICTNATDFNNAVTNVYVPPVQTSSGGGATHIAKVTGHLSALSSNLSDILIVAGGGGGGMIIDSVAYDGADAGGISGSGTNSANQTTGYAFGQGESGSGVSGGGGGLYGGYKGVS